MSQFVRRVQSRWGIQANRKSMNAVDEVGLDAALTEFGLAKRIARGELKCKYCGSPIERSRIYALFRESGQIKVVCASTECVDRLLERWSK
ncbi:MAG: hypothetical protein ACYC6C_09015 [Coriobacteriia bacterium]